MPITRELTPGRVVDLSPAALGGGGNEAARFNRGIVLASGCVTPARIARGEARRLFVETVSADAITGTVEATVAPFNVASGARGRGPVPRHALTADPRHWVKGAASNALWYSA